MKLQSIALELAACRKAFAGSKLGNPVWCCHHELLHETLTQPAKERIAYILSDKPEHEQARRLREFRPVLDVVAYDAITAGQASIDAKYNADQASLYVKYNAGQASIDAKYDADRASIGAKYYADQASLDAKLEALHAQEYPGTSWKNGSIFAY